VTVSRRARIKTNFLANAAGMAVPLATSLVTVPIYISEIGAARYGVLVLVWVLLGYFGFLDLGLSRASANALSRLGHAGAEQRVPVFVTSLYLSLGLGALGGAVLHLASGAAMALFPAAPGELAAEVTQAMPWIACMVPVALVTAVVTGALESRERFMTTNGLQVFGNVLGQVAPVVCAVLIGPSLAVVVPAAFLSRLASTLLILGFAVRGERPVDLRRFERARVRELLGYGAWVSVSSLVSPLLEALDRFLIGATLGAAAVAHYSVPMNLATRGQVISTALARTLFPRFSQLGPEEATRLAVRATISLAHCFAAACGPAIILSGPFLGLWLGADFAAHATPVAQVLLIGAWTNGIAFLPYTLLQGQGRPDLTAKIHVAELVPFVAALWLLVERFGLVGAAIAWTLRTTADCLVLLRVARCRDKGLLRVLPAAALMLLCYGVAQAPSLPPLWAALAASCMGLLTLASGLAFDPSLRGMVQGMLAGAARTSRVR
jgi:O-antigen/teichoic acid export membrane protein